MKKGLLFLVLLSLCFSAFSQEIEKAKSNGRNEIKLNLLMTLFGFPDIDYERIMSNSIGLGLSAAFPLEKSDTEYRIMPYCRLYFGESWIKSFFIEANVAILRCREYDNNSYPSYKTRNVSDIGLGVAFGYKYVNRNGYIGELFLGLGRTLEDRYYPRCGISVGKQF